MRFRLHSLGLIGATLLIGANSAIAGLVQPRCGVPHAPVAPSRVPGVALPAAFTDLLPPVAPHSETRAPDTVCELPPAPDSGTLFLYALGTMGVWRLARMSWKWHLSFAPDWYHTDAPSQIGHVKLIGWDLGQIDWAVCEFAGPSGDTRPHPIRAADTGPPLLSAGYLPSFAPRGPPAAQHTA